MDLSSPDSSLTITEIVDSHSVKQSALLNSVIDLALQLISHRTGWEDLGPKYGVTGKDPSR